MRTETKALRGALRTVSSAIARRPGIPALTGVRATFGAGRLELVGTDLEVSARVQLEAEPEHDGERWEALIPCRMLADAAKAWQGERFTIQPDGAGHVRINGAGSLRLLPVEDFPALQWPAEHVATIDAGDLRAVLEAVLPATSTDAARPVLTGVSLELDKAGAVTLAATDSYRLHVAETTGASRSVRAIVPARVLESALKVTGRKATGRVVLRVDALEGGAPARKGRPAEVPVAVSAIGFELPGGERISCRLIEGEFPNWRQLVPDAAAAEGVLRYDRAEMLGVIEQAAPYCRDTCPMRFELNGTVIASASAPDLGAYSAEVPGATWDGPEMAVAYNPLYLRDAVLAGGAELRIRDGLKPAVAGVAGDPYKRQALVMPVRLPVGAYAPPAAPEAPWCSSCAGPIDRFSEGGGPAEHAAGCSAGGDPEPWSPDPEEPAEAIGGEGWTRCEHGYGPGECCSAEVIEAEAEPDPIDVPVPPVYVEPEREGTYTPEQPERSSEPQVAELERGSTPYIGRDAGAAARALEAGRIDSAPEGDGGSWAELVNVGDVDGVRVRVVAGPDGEPRVDCRRFVDSKRYSGPTRKGFAIRASAASILAELLLDASAASAEL